MPRINQRFTVYDIMEAKGVFAANPANQDSRGPNNEPLYTGPVPYPKMFYHPEGLERTIVPGEVRTRGNGDPVLDPKTGQPQIVGELREIIWELAKDATEEARLVADGWHDHPAKALAAAGKPVPAISSEQRIAELEDQARRLQDQLDLAKNVRAMDRNRKPAPRVELS